MTSPLRTALEETGLPLSRVTVLSKSNDPFRLDTPANHRTGAWLARTIDDLGIGRIHNRGLHYAVLGQVKPNGRRYESIENDWKWLCDTALDAARWLEYISFEQITDHRNLPPVIREWTRPDPSVTASGRIEADDVLAWLTSPEPQVHLDDFRGAQPYHLVIWGEKSSLEPILGAAAERYEADLYLPTGETSDTILHQMALTSAADGRPTVVLCVADCDPSGWQMAVSVARKLQAFKVMHCKDLEFEVRRVGLTPDQVRALGLPQSPVKESEVRAGKWRERMRVEQTEIDALATLRPEALQDLIDKAVAPFFDRDLARQVRRAEAEWLAEADRVLAEHVDHHAVREATGRLERLKEHIAAEIEAINAIETFDADEIEWPDLEIPEAADNSADAPEPLCDSRWSFVEQCQRLIASKSYEATE